VAAWLKPALSEFAGEGARAILPKDEECRDPSLGVLGFAKDSAAGKRKGASGKLAPNFISTSSLAGSEG
jgi:hypothetical protein